MKVKFTRLGRREARLIRKEKELEKRLWAAEEAEKFFKSKALRLDVNELWDEYHKTKKASIKDKIGAMIQQAEDEGVQLASP